MFLGYSWKTRCLCSNPIILKGSGCKGIYIYLKLIEYSKWESYLLLLHVSRGLWCWDVLGPFNAWSSGRKCRPPGLVGRLCSDESPRPQMLWVPGCPPMLLPSQQWSHCIHEEIANLHTKPRSCSSEKAGAFTNPHSGSLRDQTISLYN